MSTYLVTGAAGFIGAKVCELLLSEKHIVVGIDNLNDYYDVRLKDYRLGQLLMEAEQYPEAITSFQRTLELSPRFSKVYQLLEPGPVVLLTTADKGRANVMTMSWHMMVEFEPPLVACVVPAVVSSTAGACS